MLVRKKLSRHQYLMQLSTMLPFSNISGDSDPCTNSGGNTAKNPHSSMMGGASLEGDGCVVVGEVDGREKVMKKKTM